jgi:signal transduction histidine kinase
LIRHVSSGFGDTEARRGSIRRAALLCGLAFAMPAPASAATAGSIEIVGGGLLLVSIAGLVLFGARWRAERRRASAAEGELALARAAAAGAPAQAVVWPAAGGSARCSPALADGLGLSAARGFDTDALIQAFRPEAGAKLRTAVEALRSRGADFALDRLITASERIYRVEGRRMADPAIDSLWLTDVTDSAAAEATLVEAHDGLARLLDALPVAAWRRDAEHRVVAGNTAYARAADADDLVDALARGAEILTGRGIEIARRAAAEGAMHAERHHVVIDGERRLLEITELPEGPEGGLLGYALDYTDVEEAEGELARHLDAHREVLEQLGVAIAIFGPDMRLDFFNTAYARLWRFDESWLATEPTYDSVLEDLRDRRAMPEQADFPAYKSERRKLFTSLLEPLEEVLHLPDSRSLRMVVTPHPMGGLLFIFEDVTDRLALERSYNTLIDVQRETLDNLYEGVAVFGGDGRLKLSNPAYARIWGLAEDFMRTEPHVADVVDRTRGYFEHGSDWGELRDRMLVRATDRIPTNGRMERLDGSVISYAKVPLPDGGVLWSYLDITDSIRVERVLRERNEALETADRLKSEFIANVSYELRTPLNAIIGFAEILNNQYFGELNERQSEYSKGIIDASSRLLALINDILDLAMIEAGRMTLERNRVDAHALLVSVFNLMRDWARKQNLQLEFHCPTDIGFITADERRIKQALFNLMSNAIKFTPEGGRVSLIGRREGATVVFEVADSGVGIAREDRTRVFEKFERGPQPDGGTTGAGLGLSLVKNFVEMHGGYVEIDSSPERGTRVICVLPAHAGPGSAIAEAS